MISKESKQIATEMSFFYVIIVVLAICSAPFFIGLSAMDQIGNTAIERVVFQNSYQYDSAQKDKKNTISAQLAQIEYKLENGNLNAERKLELESQAAALRMMVNSR